VTAIDPNRAASRVELTVRGLILGAIITVVFTAANVYFGLKAGLTFSSSIPATIFSMAFLKLFADATIQENNIVQTIASAAGTLSSIIFVLPGLIMIGWWTHFPFLASFAVCALGGILGVMYSIPLRRALVTNSDLPYPEGVACAEVLKVGAGGEEGSAGAAEGKSGLMTLIVSSVVSGLFALVIATKVFSGDVARYFKVSTPWGGGVTGYDLGMSLALFGVGHLVGLWVGLAMLLGLIISWAGFVPYLTALHPVAGVAADIAQGTWSHNVRFIGAGAIGVAAIWTLFKLAGPVISGLRSALAVADTRKRGEGASLPRTEQDMPIGLVTLISVVCLIPIGYFLWTFAQAGNLGAMGLPLVGGGLIYIVVMGLCVSAVCGYMAGLIGSSNSPLSGVGILAVIGASLLLVLLAKFAMGLSNTAALTAFALFVTSFVFAVASIANNNLQDLKTGQLVDATPWKQQVALIFGVVIGAAVIPPALDLLNKAYGFAGAPGATVHALPAPQAALISALAKGVLQGDLDWSLIGIGVVVGAAVIIIDELLGRLRPNGARIPPLAVGLGIYLPMATTLMIVVGAVVGWAYERWAKDKPYGETAQRLGVLLASGLIVGESLIGLVLAALVVFLANPAPLALVGDSFAGVSVVLGALAFIAVIVVLYVWMAKLAKPKAA
jgi:putative OPT family oligopeptide transporter